MGRGYTPAQVRASLWYIVVAWFFGAGFFALTNGAPLTSFLTKYLKTDDVSYGIIMALPLVAVVFQFIGSYLTERTGLVKRHFLIWATTHRLVWLLAALVPLLLPHGEGQLQSVRIILVGIVVFASAAIANYGGAGWMSWMSDIIPRSLAGKFFGLRSSLGMLAMIVMALGGSFLLDHFHNAGWVYALIFGVAALLGAVDILLFIPVPEVPRPPADAQMMPLDIVTTPWKNRIFCWFAGYTATAWIAYMMMGPFVWRFCIETRANHGLGMSLTLANWLLFIIPTLMMAVVAPLWGRAVDRFGAKSVMITSSVAAALLPIVWVVMRPGLEWLLWPVVILSGLTWPGIDQSLIYMQVKGFPDERRSAYNAMLAVVLGLASAFGVYFGGQLANFWQTHLALIPHLPAGVSHYQPMFVTSIVLRVVAIVFILVRLPLPNSAGQRTVYRTLAGELSSTVSKAVRRVIPPGQ
jgi:MFS family permease